MRLWLMALAGLGGLLGAVGVGLAAIGAHRSGNPNVTTAAYFLLFHAAAIIALCAIAGSGPARGPLLSASVLALGTVLFSGALALHALSGWAPVPMAAPTGGTLMIVGWLIAAVTLPLTLGRRAVS